MRTKIIPFDLETAKKIQAGEVEGKIVRRGAQKQVCEILEFYAEYQDKNSEKFLVVKVPAHDFERERLWIYHQDGKPIHNSNYAEMWYDLVLEVPEKVKQERVRISDVIERIANNFKTKQEGEAFKQGVVYAVGVSAEYRDQLGIYGKEQTSFSEKDIKEMLLKQAEEDYEKALCTARKEKLKHEFKPFDKVLVRQSDKDDWRVAFYSHFNSEENIYVTAWLNWYQCIPYEGNEHLVGTTDKPKEE